MLRLLRLVTDQKSDMHKPFTDAEIQKLFSVVFSEDIADTVLIMIYTGMRPSELLGMKTENIHLAEKYMVGGVKTKAGKGRVIPISDKVMPLVRKRYSIENRFFVDIPYHTYSKYFKKSDEQIGNGTSTARLPSYFRLYGEYRRSKSHICKIDYGTCFARLDRKSIHS